VIVGRTKLPLKADVEIGLTDDDLWEVSRFPVVGTDCWCGEFDKDRA
jgi:hypothetical protein